jgi:hypothetical protein
LRRRSLEGSQQAASANSGFAGSKHGVSLSGMI